MVALSTMVGGWQQIDWATSRRNGRNMVGRDGWYSRLGSRMRGEGRFKGKFGMNDGDECLVWVFWTC